MADYHEDELIFDMETLSDNSLNGVMVDCSALKFSMQRMISDNPYTLADLLKKAAKWKVCVEDQVKNYKYKIEPSTIEWWKKQNQSAQDKIKPLPTDITVDEFVGRFIDFALKDGKVKRWWTRGNTFDPIFIMRMAQDTGQVDRLNKALPFWGVRDTRTYIDTKLDFPKENGFIPFQDEEKWKRVFIHHESRMDIAADVLRMQVILRAECDLEPVE